MSQDQKLVNSYEEYVERYAKKHEISIEEAEKHEMVKMIKEIKDNEKQHD